MSGSRDYDVQLRWKGKKAVLQSSCTCPYFEDRLEVCKHIWATVLAASEEGLLPAVGGTDARLVPAPDLGGLRWEPGDEEDAFPRFDSTGWRAQLEEVGWQLPRLEASQQGWLGERQVFYLLDSGRSSAEGDLIVEVAFRERKKDGQWGKLKTAAPPREALPYLPDPRDRSLLEILLGAKDVEAQPWGGFERRAPRFFVLPAPILPSWLRLALETGRLLLDTRDPQEARNFLWDEGESWQLAVEVSREKGGGLRLSGCLARQGERRSLGTASLLSSEGVVFFEDRVGLLDVGGGFGWIEALRYGEEIRIPEEEKEEFLGTLLNLPRPPSLKLPEDLQVEESEGTPSPRITVRREEPWMRFQGDLAVHLSFDYGGGVVGWQAFEQGVFRPDPPRFLLRDYEAEARALARLQELGVREATDPYGMGIRRDLVLGEGRLPRLVRILTAEGWWVEAEGRLYRQGGALELSVSSGIDWFDVRGGADFDGHGVLLPRLLRALATGEGTVRLDDGSFGVLPEDWLRRLGPLSKMGSLDDDSLRFQRSQIGIIDALLASQPEIQIDQQVARARRKLAGFDGIKPRKAPRGFKTELRAYQQEGLGWLHYLRDFGFGGCLADDMGLGKTVQVLALLES
ncbi:MAG: SWIM zinc finger family protein, partial [Acidobacteria bacterium]|nr:SWIM zinc finger family protein [Acidobacteriota bacterium]